MVFNPFVVSPFSPFVLWRAVLWAYISRARPTARAHRAVATRSRGIAHAAHAAAYRSGERGLNSPNRGPTTLGLCDKTNVWDCLRQKKLPRLYRKNTWIFQKYNFPNCGILPIALKFDISAKFTAKMRQKRTYRCRNWSSFLIQNTNRIYDFY